MARSDDERGIAHGLGFRARYRVVRRRKNSVLGVVMRPETSNLEASTEVSDHIRRWNLDIVDPIKRSERGARS